jgi:hypothetical protein
VAFTSRKADLRFMFKDAGEPVTLASTNVSGLVRRAGQVLEQLGGAALASNDLVVYVLNEDIPAGFEVGDNVTVPRLSATPFKVARKFALEDGEQTVLTLQESL